jgi:hypothetical protein
MKRSLRRAGLTGLALIVVCGFFSVPAQGADRKLSLGLGFEFATGDYGTDDTTDSYKIPLMVNYYPTDRLGFDLEIPYIYQSNSTTVTLGGMRFPAHEEEGGGQQGPGHGGMGSSTTSSTTSVDLSDSQSGLGDITLTASYIVLEEQERFPLVRPLLYVKFPTADEDDGLGTGEFDYGGGLGLAKWFGKWATYLEGMYILPGSSGDFDPDNYWTYLVSASYRLTDNLRPGVSLSGGTAAFDDASDPLEARLKLSYWASERASLGGYLATGLSDGSPDFGAGIFGFVSF